MEAIHPGKTKEGSNMVRILERAIAKLTGKALKTSVVLEGKKGNGGGGT